MAFEVAAESVGLVKILIRQHRLIDRILAIADRPQLTPEQARRVTEQLRHTFLLHAQAEERVVYPRFARIPALAPWIHAARDEHEAVANALDELPDPADLARWTDAFRALRRTIVRHFVEEEEMLLPHLGRRLDIHEERDMTVTLQRVLDPAPSRRAAYP
jgi:iron-sulfur cluster repair protein YtfE (RIC family)